MASVTEEFFPYRQKRRLSLNPFSAKQFKTSTFLTLGPLAVNYRCILSRGAGKASFGSACL